MRNEIRASTYVDIGVPAAVVVSLWTSAGVDDGSVDRQAGHQRTADGRRRRQRQMQGGLQSETMMRNIAKCVKIIMPPADALVYSSVRELTCRHC